MPGGGLGAQCPGLSVSLTSPSMAQRGAVSCSRSHGQGAAEGKSIRYVGLHIRAHSTTSQGCQGSSRSRSQLLGSRNSSWVRLHRLYAYPGATTKTFPEDSPGVSSLQDPNICRGQKVLSREKAQVPAPLLTVCDLSLPGLALFLHVEEEMGDCSWGGKCGPGNAW